MVGRRLCSAKERAKRGESRALLHRTWPRRPCTWCFREGVAPATAAGGATATHSATAAQEVVHSDCGGGSETFRASLRWEPTTSRHPRPRAAVGAMRAPKGKGDDAAHQAMRQDEVLEDDGLLEIPIPSGRHRHCPGTTAAARSGLPVVQRPRSDLLE